jgi:hypothetical protein
MQNSVSFRVPNFVGEDGVEYTDIEITIQSDDGNVRDAVRLAETLERPRSADNG